MVPAFIEVVKKGDIEPTIISTRYIVCVKPNFQGGCDILMTDGSNKYSMAVQQEYVTIFEELQ